MTEQNFSNHKRVVSPFHFFAIPMLIINFGVQVYRWIKLGFLPVQVIPVLVAAALFFGALYGRLFALRVQDRVIRLEERLRYERLLPADLQSRADEFNIAQIISLRFASDAELPSLARKVLDEKLTERKAIKQLIKNWKPDDLRA